MFDHKTGDEVKAGDVIARMHLGEKGRDAEDLRARYLAFVTFGMTRQRRGRWCMSI